MKRFKDGDGIEIIGYSSPEEFAAALTAWEAKQAKVEEQGHDPFESRDLLPSWIKRPEKKAKGGSK